MPRGVQVPRAGKPPFAERKLIRFVNFSGGMNDSVSALLIKDTEAVEIQNMHMREEGTLTQRHGYTKRFAAAFATGPVRGLYNYRKENGLSYLVFCADGKVFKDAPNFSQTYDTQAQWETSGVLRNGITTSEAVGDVKPITGSRTALGFVSLGNNRSAMGGSVVPPERLWRTEDISIAGIIDATTGRVVSTTALPTGTTLVMETRSSVNGVTWGSWAALGVGDTITSPGTNTHFQLRVRFNSTSGLRASVQSLNILFDQTTVASQIATGFSTTTRWDFTTANDTLWIVNGEVAKKWDGTTFADMGGSPPLGKHIIFHKDRIWITGVSSQRSRLYYCDVGAYETWPALNFIDVGRGDGDANTGLAILNDRLVIAKDNSTWELAGNSSDNFVLRQVTTSGGCATKHSIAFVKDSLAWLGKDGIRLFDGVRSALGSKNVTTKFDGLNSRQLAQAAAVFWEPQQHYYVAAPNGASLTNNLVLVFDAERAAWTVYSGIPAAQWCIFRAFDADTLLFGSATEGQIFQMDTSGYSDNGSAIDAFVVTKAAMPAGGIEAPALVPDVMVACREPAATATNIDVSFFKDLGSESATITKSLATQALNVLRFIPSTVNVSLPRSISVKVRHNEVTKGFALSAIDIRYSPKGLRAT